MKTKVLILLLFAALSLETTAQKVQPVYVYGSAVLRKETREIKRPTPQLTRLIADLFTTMEASEGIGIAGPQIGKDLRIFVVDITYLGKKHPEYSRFKKVFINPYIYDRFGNDVSMSEGCLSVPGLSSPIMRKAAVRMRYRDENFVEHDELFDGMAARVIQHEYDHIDQHLYVDHADEVNKARLKEPLEQMARGNYKADYKTKLKK